MNLTNMNRRRHHSRNSEPRNAWRYADDDGPAITVQTYGSDEKIEQLEDELATVKRLLKTIGLTEDKDSADRKSEE